MQQWCSDTGQSKQKTVVPERRKANPVSPKIVPAYWVKSFQAAVQREGEPKQSRTVLLNREDRTENWRKPRCLKFVGQKYQRGESCLERKESPRKKAPDIFRGFAGSLYLSITQCMCEQTTRNWDNSCQKQTGGTILRMHTAQAIIWFPPVRVEKPHDT